jgi:hypothetical protein
MKSEIFYFKSLLIEEGGRNVKAGKVYRKGRSLISVEDRKYVIIRYTLTGINDD